MHRIADRSQRIAVPPRVIAQFTRAVLVTGLLGLASNGQAAVLFLDGFEVLTPVPPLPGEVVFTEIMADPTEAQDANGEWFELANVGGIPLDIEGCTVSQGGDSKTLTGDWILPPNDIFAMARSADPAVNGNVQARGVFNFSLPGTTGGSLTFACNGMTIDVVTWSNLANMDAWNLDPRFWDASGNDGAEHWCESFVPYNNLDNGTPGHPNHSCAGLGVDR